ncbi:MAG: hypothetical protein KBT57_01115 [bacterium]|nr:hypothetical protein [Candidatus Limimorpha equi]
MQTIINNAIEQINQGADWVSNKAKKDKMASYKALVKERRTLKKIRSICSTKATAVLYGQSQCGKSHLSSSLLSADGQPMLVFDRMNGVSYEFLTHLNPQGSGEATGLITRFTTQQQPDVSKEFPVHIKLMSIKDIALMLCDGYYRDIEQREPFSQDKIKQLLEDLRSRKTSRRQQYICEDDMGEIEEYFHTFSQDLYCALSATDFFGELSMMIEHLDDRDVVLALNMLWNNDPNLSQRFRLLFDACQKLDFASDAYISFDELDNSKGQTMLSVGWLDLKDTNTQSLVRYKSQSGDFKSGQIAKTYLAAICGEVVLEVVPPNADEDGKSKYISSILNNVDVLDFPGARPRGGLLTADGKEETLLRRGKVGYYFNKYSAERKINSLLFCWQPDNFDAKPMESVLRSWVDIAIGKNEEERAEYMKDLDVPPLFFVGTKFNFHLQAKTDDRADNNNALTTRWDKWFREQLSKDIIGIPTEPNDKNTNTYYKWFESWTTANPSFDNCYLLRDFRYSTTIYKGWKETGKETTRECEPYSGFYAKLRDSFINDSFVRKHFKDAAIRWDEASEPNCDGSLPIARNLASIVGKIAAAAEAKNKRDVMESLQKVIDVLKTHYYDNNSEVALKKALNSAARLQASLDHAFGHDPYYFGRFMEALTIKEYAVHEVFSNAFSGLGDKGNMGDYVMIYLRAPGLKSSNTFETNLEILRNTYFFDNIQNCRDHFENELKIDLEYLFKKSEFGLQSPSQVLAATLKDYLFDTWLGELQKKCLSDMLGESTYGDLVDMLKSLFEKYEIDRKIAMTIHEYVDTFGVNVKELSEMIADMGAEMVNSFMLSVGYDFYTQSASDDVMKYLRDANQQHQIGLCFKFIEGGVQQTSNERIADIMAKMDDRSNIRQLMMKYSQVGVEGLSQQDIDDFSACIPGFRQSCRWRDLAKIGYVLTKDIPQYNIEDNDQLGRIIEKCRTLNN